jgi:cyanate permease
VGVFGYAIGPALVGFLYEASGGYTIPYLAIAFSSLLGMAVFAFAGPTRQ